MKSVYLTLAITTAATAALTCNTAQAGTHLDHLSFIEQMKTDAKSAYVERRYGLAEERQKLYLNNLSSKERNTLRVLITEREKALQQKFTEKMAILTAMKETAQQNILASSIKKSLNSYNKQTADNAATYLAQSDAARGSFSSDRASFIMP
jgi:hypothetical protein